MIGKTDEQNLFLTIKDINGLFLVFSCFIGKSNSTKLLPLTLNFIFKSKIAIFKLLYIVFAVFNLL